MLLTLDDSSAPKLTTAPENHISFMEDMMRYPRTYVLVYRHLWVLYEAVRSYVCWINYCPTALDVIVRVKLTSKRSCLDFAWYVSKPALTPRPRNVS